MSTQRRIFTILAACPAAILAFTAAALGQDGTTASTAAASAPTGLDGIPSIWWIALASSFVGLMFAVKFYYEIMSKSEGDDNMKLIAGFVRDGAYAYLWRQYKVVAWVFVALSLVLSYLAYGLGVQHKIVPFAFLTGGFFSGLCGFFGMKTATNASHRTAAGARESLNQGLVVAFRAGSVMGLVVVGFALLDVTGWFIALRLWGGDMSLTTITVVMLTFGMGASTQALFARVGGGIYTKAADVGADLVGKVEAGIPEDDSRNPATIADNVGDNVGDVAGMGADLYESYAGSILATAALGVAAAVSMFGDDTSAVGFDAGMRLVATPMVLAGVGILLSIVGIYMVKTKENANLGELMAALNRGIWGSSAFILIAALGVCYYLLGPSFPKVPDGGTGPSWLGIWGSIASGLIAGVIIGKATEIYTSYDFKPTQELAAQAITGPATIIIGGIAEGMKSTWASLFTVIVAILVAFVSAGGATEYMLGLYGVGIAAVGMLATLGITLATDAYGPIADNAGGNAEMTHQQPQVRQRTDALDSLGNTTAATGKGFAIGSAALTALALLAAYIDEVRIGMLHEAETYVQRSILDGSPDKSAAVAPVYIGYGKFALKEAGDPKKLSSYGALMCPEFKEIKLMESKGLLKKGQRFTAAEYVDGKREDNYEGTLNLGQHHLKVVRVRRASMDQFMSFYNITLMNPRVLCGLFAGVLLTFLFCALTMKAVGRAANQMMLECRRQFALMRSYLKGQGHDDAYIRNPDNWPRTPVSFQGGQIPDYASCVAISTAGAQKEMVFPSLLAIIAPVLVGLVFGVAGVMGLLAGGLVSGFAVAVFMANSGGAWDNAKKYIETFGKISAGAFKKDPKVRESVPAAIREAIAARAESAESDDEIIYGKGSSDHKAGVVGDTVGDPFKDTSGPSLNILIKLMSMVSVVFAGLVVAYGPRIGELLKLGQ
ncbi:Putative K(+)-stimulated pyrophosphate-energized sodium pump [Phycisphaerae bacterium RAS2]|nr:Putative K(+)-stimulated pyrophosphate-energized sodium pump [Phycisphaerae bacterium RAS2]